LTLPRLFPFRFLVNSFASSLVFGLGYTKGGDTMKFVLGAVAAALLAGAAFVQPAEARCFWNGFAMECFHSGPHYWHRHFYRDWDGPRVIYRDWY
jgi:hypothetical protein